MKRVRKLVPVDFLDMHGIESWLEDMAARGLFFTEMGSCFARFRRGRPMPIRYHAEPSGSVPASLAREQVDYSAGRGWHYAGPFGRPLPSTGPMTRRPRNFTPIRWPRATRWSI